MEQKNNSYNNKTNNKKNGEKSFPSKRKKESFPPTYVEDLLDSKTKERLLSLKKKSSK